MESPPEPLSRRMLTPQASVTVESAEKRGADVTDHRGAATEAIELLPRDVGWFLLLGGIFTEFGAPGVPPFWILGLMVLWPRFGRRVGQTLNRRTPRLFQASMLWAERFARDLDSRYPLPPRPYDTFH